MLIALKSGRTAVRQFAKGRLMPAFLYRCPATGSRVQAWSGDAPTEDEAERYAHTFVERRYFGRPVGKAL